MSWQNEMVRIVRFLINDIDADTYSDSRLEETILASAQLVYTGIDFSKDYTIDVDTLVLTPDPTASPKDDWFINLVCVKTACIIMGSEVKTLAGQSFTIKDGPASIDVSNAYKASKELYDDLCDRYDIMVVQYKVGDSVGGNAIMTPYTQSGLNVGGYVRNFNYFT